MIGILNSDKAEAGIDSHVKIDNMRIKKWFSIQCTSRIRRKTVKQHCCCCKYGVQSKGRIKIEDYGEMTKNSLI